MTERYAWSTQSLQEAGRELHVADIVTGHYVKVGDRLQITVEEVDVGSNRVIWQDEINVPAVDMIAMRDQIIARVRQGLMPVLENPRLPTVALVPRIRMRTVCTCGVLEYHTIPRQTGRRLIC